MHQREMLFVVLALTEELAFLSFPSNVFVLPLPQTQTHSWLAEQWREQLFDMQTNSQAEDAVAPHAHKQLQLYGAVWLQQKQCVIRFFKRVCVVDQQVVSVWSFIPSLKENCTWIRISVRFPDCKVLK